MEQIQLPHRHGEQENIQQVEKTLNQVQNFALVAQVFKQLGDTTRVRLFWLLCHCRECVVNLSAMMGMSAPAISHHLRLLRNSGLIVGQRIGKEMYYTAADTPQSQLLHQMIEQVMKVACPGEEI